MDKELVKKFLEDLKVDNADDLFRALCLGHSTNYVDFCTDKEISAITSKLGLYKSGSGVCDKAEEILYDGILYLSDNKELNPVTEGGCIILERPKGTMDWNKLLKAQSSPELATIAQKLNDTLLKKVIVKLGVQGCIPESHRAEFEEVNLSNLVSGNLSYEEGVLKTLVTLAIKGYEELYRKSKAVARYRLGQAQQIGLINIGENTFRNLNYSETRDLNLGLKKILRKQKPQDMDKTIDDLICLIRYSTKLRMKEVNLK